MNRDLTAYTHEQLLTEGQISGEDLKEIKQCRRTHNRLGFAYQLTFVKLFGRFPVQQPLEVIDEVLVFVST